MTNNPLIAFHLSPFQPGDQQKIRPILERIGWAEPYIQAFEQAAVRFAESADSAVFMARVEDEVIGFIFVEFHAWHQLAQIQGLAVNPAYRHIGVASALVAQAEAFARAHQARGIYLDTPTTNLGGRRFYEARGYQTGYLMPRYYEAALDGVTYQKFFA